MKTNSTIVIGSKLAIAKVLYKRIISHESALFKTRDQILGAAWLLGRVLDQLKEEIGHGKWLLWLPSNFPELGKTDGTITENASRCIRFFKENQSPSRTGPKISGTPDIYTIDSVRKFMWGYIPAKERLQLEGDEDIKPGAHHLTFVNQFSKYDRQLRSGHVDAFDLELFKREIEPMIRRIVELCGKDWLTSILPG